MRKVVTGLAVLLLAVTSAQGTYILALEDQSAGPGAPGTYTIGLTLVSDGQPSATYGDTAYLGAQGVLAPLPAGWTVWGLTYNTVDFDPDLIVGTDLAGVLAIATEATAYTEKKTLLSFTLFAPTPGQLALDPSLTGVVDSRFNTVFAGPGDLVLIPLPEPATALLLLTALPLLRRRWA